jgi:hypothetical protein
VKLNEELPKPVGVLSRAIGYGIGLAIVLALLMVMGRKGLVTNTLQCLEAPGMFDDQQSALRRAQAMAACLDRKNGFLEGMMMSSINKTLRTLPNAPCKYVGVWNSFQPQCTYTIALDAIGEFTAEPLNCSISSDSMSGSWGVHKNQMVWMYKQGRSWPPDVNSIQDVDANSFLLVEANGSRTVFTRVAALPSPLCPN